jgi:hypothetical protein
LRREWFNEKSRRASKNAPGNFLWWISGGKSLKPKVDFKLTLTKLHDLSELAVWMSSTFSSNPPCYA